MEIGWKFPALGGGEAPGFNEMGGKGHFVGLGDMVREAIQNSLDAYDKKSGTVRVVFSAVDVPRSEIPGREELEAALSACAQEARSDDSRKAQRFFEQATHVVRQQHVPFLVIRDFGTTGIRGSDHEGGDWTRLVRRPGASRKGDDSGGSWGEGRHAFFSISRVGSVFYGTYDIDRLHALQGVARLIPHRDQSGETTQATGFFGCVSRNLLPITDPDLLRSRYARFFRDQPGTDIWIAGAALKPSWADEVQKAVLVNFLVSLWRERLIVEVDGRRLDRDALPGLVAGLNDNETKAFWQVLSSEQTKILERPIPEKFGIPDSKLELMLLVRSDMPRRTLLTRSIGMKIDVLDRRTVDEFTPFAGVLLPRGSKLSGRLRDMEGPAHKGWDAQRTEDEYPQGKELLKYIRQSIREMVAEATDTGAETVGAAGVREYLWDDVDLDVGEGGPSDGPVDVRRDKPPQVKAQGFGGTKTPHGVGGGGGGGGGSPGPGGSGGPGLPLDGARVWCRSAAGGRYRLALGSDKPVEGFLRFGIVGEDGKIESAPVIAAADAASGRVIPVDRGRVGPVRVGAGERRRVDVTLGIKGKYVLALSVESGGEKRGA